jgi:hypothetical protein
MQTNFPYLRGFREFEGTSAGWLHAQADDVRGFMVLVDQLRHRVVEIDPQAHKVVYSWIAGRPRLTCQEKFDSGG